MRILAFRHVPFEGLGLIEASLSARGIGVDYASLYESGAVPDTAGYDGLISLGGPMSANDDLPYLRQEMRLLLKAIHRRIGVTTVFVTHDQNEAASIAHRIAFVRNGRVEQHGPPRDFFLAPATRAAACFFGWQVLETTHGQSTVFRPESAQLHKGGIHTVQASVDLGLRARTSVRLPDSSTLDVEHALPAFAEGDCVTLEIPPSAILVIKE